MLPFFRPLLSSRPRGGASTWKGSVRYLSSAVTKDAERLGGVQPQSLAGSLQQEESCSLAALLLRRWQSSSGQGVLGKKGEGGGDRQLFKKLLIANRGEIACRVMRTCRRLGVKTVAVHSEPDAEAPHVRMADEAVCVGPAASSESYLNMDAIVKACLSTGAEAVHPGYGFLSENSRFVERLEKEGITFVGPSAYALSAMGDKIESKALAIKARVNTIPGRPDVIRDAEHAVEIANQVGYPVMLKATAGGGGKGMRIARDEEEVLESFQVCQGEAISSFGDGRIFIERFIEEPRHIEIQVMADSYGETVYLPERECSIQRRNQKVIEEAPSTFLDPTTRQQMGEQAVALAKAVQYKSAGTVEFLVDKHRNFYFLEMNTRLQVEHPITECVTQLDLVEVMLRVAAGERLSDLGLNQQRAAAIHGWALESRVYAEDPRRGFLPSNGRLRSYVEPTARHPQEVVRVDSGVVEGSDISIYYDPLISKLVTWGPNRDSAIASMEDALDRYVIRGVTHNAAFMRSVISHPAFRAGKLTTKFLQEHYPDGWSGHHLEDRQKDELMAMGAVLHYKRQHTPLGTPPLAKRPPPHAPLELVVSLDSEKQSPVTVTPVGGGDTDSELTLEVDFGREIITVIDRHANVRQPMVLEMEVDGAVRTCQLLQRLPRGIRMQFAGGEHDVIVQSPLQAELAKHMPPPAVADYSKVLRSPMPGALVSVAVQVGQAVSEGEELAVVEAMKMRNVLRAVQAGVVKAVPAKAGSILAMDEVIVEFE